MKKLTSFILIILFFLSMNSLPMRGADTKASGFREGDYKLCVMYPPLCFVKTYDDENVCDDEVQVRWRIIEWWEEFLRQADAIYEK